MARESMVFSPYFSLLSPETQMFVIEAEQKRLQPKSEIVTESGIEENLKENS